MATSDLPYVQGDGQRVRADPVFPVDITDWINRSSTVAAADTVFELFPTAAPGDVTVSRRLVAHVGDEDSGSLWINWLGGDAGVNAPGSFELLPGDIMPIPTRARVTALGTVVALPFTAAEG